MRGDDVGFATLKRAGDAEKADYVGVVGVEELSVSLGMERLLRGKLYRALVL